MSLKIIPVIVTHNRLEKLKKAVRAIEHQSVHKIVIVDNDSERNTRRWLAGLDPTKFDVVFNHKNGGGAGGFSIGAKRALLHQPDWVLFFDDDAYASPRLIQRFSERVETENVDLVSALVKTPEGDEPVMNSLIKQYPSTMATLLRYALNKNAFLVSSRDCDAGESIKIKAGSFVGLFVSRSCLEEMRAFILPGLFLYYDDLYFTLSCHEKGFNHLLFPDIEFVHCIPKDSCLSSWKIYLLMRNQFVMKEFSSKPAFACHVMLKILRVFWRVLASPSKKEGVRALCAGVAHGWKVDFSLTKDTRNPVEKITTSFNG